MTESEIGNGMSSSVSSLQIKHKTLVTSTNQKSSGCVLHFHGLQGFVNSAWAISVTAQQAMDELHRLRRKTIFTALV